MRVRVRERPWLICKMQVRDLKSSKVFEEVLEIGFFSLKICFFSFHLFLTSLSAQKLIGEGEKKYLFFSTFFLLCSFTAFQTIWQCLLRNLGNISQTEFFIQCHIFRLCNVENNCIVLLLISMLFIGLPLTIMFLQYFFRYISLKFKFNVLASIDIRSFDIFCIFSFSNIWLSEESSITRIDFFK